MHLSHFGVFLQLPARQETPGTGETNLAYLVDRPLRKLSRVPTQPPVVLINGILPPLLLEDGVISIQD
jgi:hypothetical protein